MGADASARLPAGGSRGGRAERADGTIGAASTSQRVAVQVPVSVAANVCDVNVAVLVDDLVDDAASCDAVANPIGRITR